jgi:predicted amidohydrolase
VWEDAAANLSLLESMLNQLPAHAEVVLLPEMFSTGFSMQPERLAETMNGPTVSWMQQQARQRRIILCGSLIIEEEGLYYNRLIWMLPNGQYGTYNKRHLFSYAHEEEHYTAGDSRLIASVKGWKLNLQICYDLRFPIWARQQQQPSESHNGHAELEPEYDVLVYVANWPERRSFAWKSLLTARAIENQCYTIGVNRVGDDGNGIHHSGDSAVIDPLGATLHTIHGEAGVYTCTLSRQQLTEVRQQFRFLNDADQFMIIT